MIKPYQLVHLSYKNNNVFISIQQTRLTPGIYLDNIEIDKDVRYNINVSYISELNNLFIVCVDSNSNIIFKNNIINSPYSFNIEHNEYTKLSMYILCNEPKIRQKITINKISIDTHYIDKYKHPESYELLYNNKNNVLTDKITDINFKNKKILVTSTQYPSYGGAATNAYGFIKFLRDNDVETMGIFFDNRAYSENKNIDLDNIGGILLGKTLNYYKYFNNGVINKCTNKGYLNMIKYTKEYFNGLPDIVIGFNYLAPIISKHIFPTIPNVYAVTGSTYITSIPQCVTKYLKNIPNDVYMKQNRIESGCLSVVDKIMFNTNIMENVFTKCNPYFEHKYTKTPLDLTKIMSYKNKKISEKREYDVCIITSRFDREIKNIGLAERIFNGLPKLKKLAIGLYSEEHMGKYKNTITLPLISHGKVLEYLQKSKVLIMPSYFESASIVVREAIMNDCLIVTSNNIGLSDRISELFLCSDINNENEWINKIKLLTKNYDIIKNIVPLDYDQKPNDIAEIIKNIKTEKIKRNILVVSVDTPYIGGSGTNSYRIIKYLRKFSEYNVYGLYIDNTDNIRDPDNIGNIFKFVPKKDNLDDNKIKEYGKSMLNELKINNIDVIFAKNYKSVIITRKMFENAKIIFSPSGSRFFSLYCHDNNKEVSFNTVMQNINENTISYNFDEKMTVYDYLKQDRDVETIANELADVIVTNSSITHNFFLKLYAKYKNKMYNPISLSNICNRIDTCKNKKYDIVFLSHNWKRKVKNANKLIEIINHEKMKNLKINIIGSKYEKIKKKAKYDNVIFSGLCDQNMVRHYLKLSNTLVMVSLYDSNPNAVVEAIYSGCKAIVSTNIGQYIYLPDDYIVKDYDNTNEWINKIINSINSKNINYSGPDITDVIIDVKNCIEYTLNNERKKESKISVGVYKVPPLWDNNEMIKKDFKYIDMKEKSLEIDNIIHYDIFYKLFNVLSKNVNCDEFHYIIGKNINANIKYDISNFFPNLKGVYIWEICSASDLLYFSNADYYFLRGLYHKTYGRLLKDVNAKVVHYRATSIPHGKKLEKITVPYNIVIHDGNEEILNKIYPDSKLIKFYKFAHPNFIFKNMERIYDICFVATADQPTKNHNLFIDFLKYCENKRIKISAVYVGDYTKLKCFKELNFNTVELKLHKSLPRNDLVNIYNISKINILFSGRDCCPRVITESLYCGCFNIALDTLSDGKWIYNLFFGELIGSEQVPIIKTKSHSVAYKSSGIIFDKIIKSIKRTYNHEKIAIEAYKTFNLKVNVNNITNELIKLNNKKNTIKTETI